MSSICAYTGYPDLVLDAHGGAGARGEQEIIIWRKRATLERGSDDCLEFDLHHQLRRTELDYADHQHGRCNCTQIRSVNFGYGVSVGSVRQVNTSLDDVGSFPAEVRNLCQTTLEDYIRLRRRSSRSRVTRRRTSHDDPLARTNR